MYFVDRYIDQFYLFYWLVWGRVTVSQRYWVRLSLGGIKYFIFSFPRFGNQANRDATLRSVTQYAMLQEFGGKWGAEVLIGNGASLHLVPWFPLPTLL